MLFDSISTFSYVSAYFSLDFGSSIKPLATSIRVSTLVEDSLVVDLEHQSCVVTFVGHDTWVDLIVLDMVDFDVILGMDWVSPYHVVLYYYAKTMT